MLTNRGKIAAIMSFMMAVSFVSPSSIEAAKPATSTVKTVNTKSNKSNTNSTFKPASLKKVNLSKNSYVQIDDIQFYHAKNDKIVYYTVTVVNKDSKPINLLDYWFSIRSTTGESYPISLMGLTEKKDNLVRANTTKTFKVYTKVNSKLNLHNLLFDVIKWDFSRPNLERRIGTIGIPAKYSNVTPVGVNREIKSGSTTLLTTPSSLQLIENGNQTEANLTLQIKNKTAGTVTLNPYKFYLRTNQNRNYLLESEQTDIQVLPGETKSIKLHTKLPDNMRKEKYQLFIAEESGTETKVEIPLAYSALTIKQQAEAITGKNQENTLLVDGQVVRSKVANMMVDSNTEYHNITLSYELKNAGKKPVKLPKYQYYLSTFAQTMFPLETTDTETDITLLPGVTKEITMTASLPANVSMDGLKLIVRKTADEGKRNDYVVGQHVIPSTEPIKESSKSTYVNKQGAYEVSVENFERLPWDSQDIVNATVTVKNIGKEIQPMPKMAATTWFNGVKINSKDIKMLAIEEKIGLNPGESGKLILTTKVSSQAKFTNAKVQLSETVDDKPIKTMGNFMVSADKASIPVYQPGSTSDYTLEQPGMKATLGVVETNTYETKGANVVESLLTYRNVGTRYGKLPSLQAYYYLEDGTQIPAKITTIETEVGPDSANLISVSATVPKRYTAQDLKLLVGQGIAGGKYASGNEKADSYVNAALLALKEENKRVHSLFEPLELRPYTFKFNRINAVLNGEDSVQFNFEYNLSSYKPFDHMMNKRKLVMEIEYNGKKVDKPFEFETSGGLSIGDKIKGSFTINDLDMKGIVNSGFTLNIYDEVNDARKLLLTHKVYSFGAPE
ncbi:hypothetical protein NQ117_13925 [Paenibacillus sp. SC116]|uniref:hypothetical protein n=1 Tax=Paenibacillus sp. SC116 TaxID=2968986 RepID=UPI00215B0A44|nr:hypothetical protein [Paenibacillus sp. SC116]MCR8844785.1 hypothetical protein [Paenibacillus sp. SC116]